MTSVPPQPAAAAAPSYWALLRDNRNFRRLWLGQVVSQIGDWLDYAGI